MAKVIVSGVVQQHIHHSRHDFRPSHQELEICGQDFIKSCKVKGEFSKTQVMKNQAYRLPLNTDVSKTPMAYYLRDRMKNSENVRGTVRVQSHTSGVHSIIDSIKNNIGQKVDYEAFNRPLYERPRFREVTPNTWASQKDFTVKNIATLKL